MPAPGPKDGHASRASRDLKLTRGASAKSNGFKYGGGGRDLDHGGGQGAGGVRTGISNSLRDQRSRKALQRKFFERKRKREEEEENKEEEEGRKDRFTTRDDDENFDDETKTKKKRRRLDEESEGEKREKEEEEKEEADAVTSSDPVVSTKKESKILITFPWMCDVCFEGEGRKVVAQSEHQRNDHLNSKKHKKNCEKRRGRELLRTMFFAEKKETTLGT